MGKYRGRIWSSVGRRLENECTSSDPGIVSYGIVPCDGHLLYAGTQVRQREICAFKLPVCGQLCLYGRVHIYGKRHNRDVLIYDGCGMPVLFFLYCLKGVSSQEKLFVPYVFWSVFHHRQQPETYGNDAFAAPDRLGGVLSGKCAAHGSAVIDTGIV